MRPSPDNRFMTHAKRLALVLLVALSPFASTAFGAPKARALGSSDSALVYADGCASCGKKIYFGERCLTCIAKETKADHSRPCEVCDKAILFGSLCTRCTYDKATSELAHKCLGCENTIYLGTTCASCTAGRLERSLGVLVAKGEQLTPLAKEELDRLLAGLQEKAKNPVELSEGGKARANLAAEDAKATGLAFAKYASAAADYAKKSGRAIGETAADLELKQRAATIVGAAVETARVLEATKRRVATRSFQALGKIPVHTELGWTSLSGLAQYKLLEVAPEMAGTALAEDPAAVLAALVVADHMYVMMDLNLVATEGEPISIMEFLALRGTQSPTRALAAATALVSIRRIRAGEELSKSIRDLSRAIEVLAEPIPEKPATSGAK
jgi:hypothetical protein